MQTNAQSVDATPKQTRPTGSAIQKAKVNFPLQFKKKKLTNQKKIDQSDSCGFSAQLRVCVKTLIRGARNKN